MKKLNFNIYQKKLKVEVRFRNPTQHMLEDDNKIILSFKTYEGHEYYTIVKKSDIVEFSELAEIDDSKAIDDFKINYCTHAVSVESFEFDPNDPLYLQEEEAEESELDEIKLSSFEIDAGDDIVKESKSYSEFISKVFSRFEKQTLNAVDSMKLDKSYDVKKNFGSFMAGLFNAVNSTSFLKYVKQFVKSDMVKGLESAEDELGVDVGFNDNFQQKLSQLYSNQIDGYTINGKKWFGIKGVTKEIQAKTIHIVQDGIDKGKSTKEIKEEISSTFYVFTGFRSEAIARTESNRIISESKLLTYKESGMKGKKVWSTAMDNRTSDICRRLNGQEVDLDDDFIDPATLKSYHTTPGHVHCRSTIFFKPD